METVRGIPVGFYEKQVAFLKSKAFTRGFVGGRGAGKALSLDTLLPTLDGWVTMGDVKVGNRLFDEDGSLCSVIGVTDIQYGRPCYLVTLSDGTEIVADAEHEWLTHSKLDRKTGRVRPQKIITTTEIKETLKYQGHEKNHSIHNCAPIKGRPFAKLPIKPYTLGAWLGDGTSIYARITCCEQEILQSIEKDGYECIPDRTKTSAYSIVNNGIRRHRNNRTGKMESHPNNFCAKLRNMSVLGNKHIPTQYLRASVHKRKQLLKGLMDTDGCVDVTGRCEYTSTSRKLIECVHELCVSLGIKTRIAEGRATLNGKDCGAKYRLSFTPYFPAFTVKRKLDRQHSAGDQSCRQMRRYVSSVEPVKSVPVKCIEVDSPSNLYLCSKSFIPTHNSFVGAYDLIKRAKKGRHYMVIAPTHKSLRDGSFESLLNVTTTTQRLKSATKSPDLAMKIYTEDGGIADVITRSGERPDLLKGPNLSGIWIDEAAEQKKEVYLFALATLREKGELGWATMTFTPKGKHHWTYEIFYDGFNQRKRGTKLIRAKTNENHFLPPEFYTEIASQYSKRMQQQELDGEFVDFEGLLFNRDWFDFASPQEVAGIVEWVRYWDKAGTAEIEGGKKTNSAYSVGVLMGRTKNNVFYVRDVVRGRWSALDREERIKKVAALDYARFGQVQIWTEQEPGSGGKESAQATVRNLAGYNVRMDRVTGDKITRGGPFVAQSEAGNIKIVEADWNQDWLDEICAVPEGRYKDQYDASVGAFSKLAIRKGHAKLFRRMLGDDNGEPDSDAEKPLVVVSPQQEYWDRILEQDRLEDGGVSWLSGG